MAKGTVRYRSRVVVFGLLAVFALVAAGCSGDAGDAADGGDTGASDDSGDGGDDSGGSDDSGDGAGDGDDSGADTTDDSGADAAADSGDEEAVTGDDEAVEDEPEEEPEEEVDPAVTTDGSTVSVDWSALPSTPFFSPAADGPDPLFLIHTNPATDGVFISFEMYTEWGQGWTGETGTFEITCSDPGSSTGICPYYDPDGPGPLAVLGGDFATTGSITINQLDGGGYDLVIHSLVFSDGTTFDEFALNG